MKLIVNREISNHPSQDTVKEFEMSIFKDPGVSLVDNSKFPRLSRACMFFYEFNRKHLERVDLARFFIPRVFPEGCFAVLMGPGDFIKCLPQFLSAKRKHVYLFDAFNQNFSKIADLIDYFDISTVFFSSSQATDWFRAKYGPKRVHWIAEAVEPDDYSPTDYRDRDIDIVQFGRKYDLYHKIVKRFAEKKNFSYLYERSKGEIIFPDRASFVEGIGRAKISICIPSSVTHPERSGDVSTVTARYYQSMASKCLVVGVKPKEMDELFRYNPIVEIDFDRPEKQLAHILSHFDEYIPLIERNYREMRSAHTWTDRWKQAKACIFSEQKKDCRKGCFN